MYWLHNCIEWQLSPPAASHMVEELERFIRSVHKILILGANQQTFTDEKLHTFMCLAESIVNNRPLSIVSDDP